MGKSNKARRGLYDLLRQEHFSPLEAREFSKLSKYDSALAQMRGERVKQWAYFKRRVREKGWRTNYRIQVEWLRTLTRSYRRRGWSVFFGPHKGKPSPWEWWRARYDMLPPELQRGTPTRKAKAGKRVQEKIDKGQVNTRRWIAQLTVKIREATDRKQRDAWVRQRASLKRGLGR